MQQQVSNIRNICTSVLNQMKEYGIGQKDYPWLENIFIRFYSDRLRGFHMPSVKTIKYPVDLATRIWTFPPDCIVYTKFAYRCSGSQSTHILGLNPDMDISEPLPICTTDIEYAPQSAYGYYFSGDGGNNANYEQPLYATGGGFAQNYYRVDDERNCVRFFENLPVGMAFMEYLSAGVNVCGDTIVPLGYRAASEAWLIVRVCQLKPSVMRLAAPVYRDLKDDAKIQMWDSNTLMKGLTEQELRDTCYRACGFTLR